MIVPSTDEELMDTLASCYNSTKLFGQTFMPDTFFLPFTEGHDQIFEILDDDSIQLAAISAPRGFGKSSIVDLLFPIKKIVYRDEKFIATISNSATQAELQSEDMKGELLDNDNFSSLFNIRTPKGVKGLDARESFSRSQWVTYTPEGEVGTMVLPRGSGQKIRGVKFRNYRPGLIIIDDLEDDEAVENEDIRKKLKSWVFSSVMASVDKHHGKWRIVFVGTPLHEDSLLRNLVEDPNWVSIELSICSDDYKSNWPGLYTDAEIMQMVHQYREQGELDTFYREYMGRHVASEDAVFKPEYWTKNYYNETEEKLWNNKNLINVIILDPAKTVKVHSSDSAIVCVGIDRSNRRLYVRDLIAKKMYPEEIYHHLFDMANRFHARTIAVEVTGLSEFIKSPIINQASMTGRNYELIWLEARGKKEDRIASLAPFYRQGLIHHNMIVTGQLEAQLVSFPRSKRMDAMDALAYVVILMEKGNLYFHPESWGDFIEKNESIDEELEYGNLGMSYNRPLSNWRMPGI